MNNINHLNVVLDKMHEIIGVNFDNNNLETFDYSKYFWSYEQERFFKDWMIGYLQNNKGAREFFMKNPSKNLRVIEAVVNEFVFTYGWKYK